MADSADNSTPGKSPAFQFYPKDFLTDRNVVLMSMQERGVYITLLCHCWDKPLPSDVPRLAAVCGVPVASFRKLWPGIQGCFEASPHDPSALIHPRLEREREKQEDYRRRQSDSGKAGAGKRWGRHDLANRVAIVSRMGSP